MDGGRSVLQDVFVMVLSLLQVTAHCQEAKDYLEMMCRDLTNELADFDHQKEQELRAVFLEYASLFSGKFQRVSDGIIA